MRLLPLSIFAVIWWCPTDVNAQKETSDGPVGIFSSATEYDQFMRSAKQIAAGNEELKAMIPMLNDIALDRPIGWTNQQYGGQGSTLDLLSNENVRAELDIVDEQYKELQRMGERVQKRASEQLVALDFDDHKNLIDQIRKIREQAEGDVNSVLLPHQLARLRQLRSQSQLRHRSLVDVITSEPLMTELGISDEQSKELRESARVIEVELQEEIDKLRARARHKFLSKLGHSQREKVEMIFGETFEFGKNTAKTNAHSQRK